MTFIQRVETEPGIVEIIQPNQDRLQEIRSGLPMGIVRYQTPVRGATHGIVMQCGEHEVFGVKQQPIPCDQEMGMMQFEAHSVLIAFSFASYLRSNEFRGLLMPCPYMRDKDGGQVESGIVYFGKSQSAGNASRKDHKDLSYDRTFGEGFSPMLYGFMNALQRSSQKTMIPLFSAIGIDIRPRLHMGNIGFGFMVHDSEVICLKTIVSNQDPTWTFLRAAGVIQVLHIPSVPIAIREDQISMAMSGEL